MSDNELVAFSAIDCALGSWDWSLRHMEEFGDLSAGGSRLFLQQAEQPDFFIRRGYGHFADVPVSSQFVDQQ